LQARQQQTCLLAVIPVSVFQIQDQQQQIIYVIKLHSPDQQHLMVDLLLVRGQELVNQCRLARLLRVNAIACFFNVSVVVSLEQDMRGVSCLVCHHQFIIEENFRDMVACLRVGERVCWNSFVDCLVTKWFHP
jgi:hypothetical protein